MTSLNWTQIRAEYVAGSESFADVSRRLTISLTAVEKHALNSKVNGGRTWGELRAAWRSEQGTAVIERTAEAQGELLARIALNRLRFAHRCLTRLLELDPAELTFRQLIEGAKLGIDTRVQVEVPKRIEVVVKLDPPSPEQQPAFDLQSEVFSRVKPRGSAYRSRAQVRRPNGSSRRF